MNQHIVQITFELWGALFCFICAGITIYAKKTKVVRNTILAAGLTLNAILLIFDCLAYLYRGDVTHVGYIMVRVSNLAVFALTAIMMNIVPMYMGAVIKSNGKQRRGKISEVIFAMTMIDLIIIIVGSITSFTYYFDASNVYHRGPGYIITVLIAMTIIVVTIVNLMINRKVLPFNELVTMLIYLVMPVVSAVFQYFNYGLSINNIVCTLGILMIFVINEKEKNERLLKQEKVLLEVANQAKEMAIRKNQIAISQIKPHFVLNCLSSISMMCSIDPEKAREAIDRFSIYLRNSINSMGDRYMLGFSEELEHIRAYVWLEDLRFGEMLNYTEEIETDQFVVPALSVQPIVENAIKYSLKSREGVVDVKLAVRRNDEGIEIIVKDNGMGFDPDEKKNDGRVHVGISNVRDRIELLCDGTVSIDSVIGEGTTVTIKIPSPHK